MTENHPSVVNLSQIPEKEIKVLWEITKSIIIITSLNKSE